MDQVTNWRTWRQGPESLPPQRRNQRSAMWLCMELQAARRQAAAEASAFEDAVQAASLRLRQQQQQAK